MQLIYSRLLRGFKASSEYSVVSKISHKLR